MPLEWRATYRIPEIDQARNKPEYGPVDEPWCVRDPFGKLVNIPGQAT
jgi:hypothetical protein